MSAPELSVRIERKPGSLVSLHVEATADEVDAAIAGALRRLAARMRIPGFRPGKAPGPLVERAAGWEAVRQETVDHLVPDLYERAVEQSGLEPVADPELSIEPLEREQPLTFTATVTVKPDVDLGDYLSVRVAYERTEITDERVSEAIAEVRRRHAELVEVERPAQLGDVVRCTLVMRHDDETLSGDDAGERDLELDRDVVLAAIVDGIMGMAAGEQRTFPVTLPEDYRREELRGASVTVDVTVHAVRERRLPPADDALASLDGHGTTLTALREHYRQALTASALEADRERHEARVLAAFRDSVRVDIPEVMIDSEVERQLADLEFRISAIGIPFDRYLELSGQTLERLRGERREAATQRVKLDLGLDALAAAEGVEVDEAQVEREARSLAEGRKLDARRRRRLAELARRDLVRRATANRLLEIVAEEFVPT
jgi:trigger factor